MNMKNFKYFFAISILILTACSKEEVPTYNEQIKGVWNLTNIIQRKESQIKVLQNGNSTFEFKLNSVSIIGDTYLNKTGKYSYIISNENYFKPELIEPKNNVLKIGDHKYLVEIEYEGKNMILTNYSDGRIIYYLSK
ncbi:hypothetical protein IQ02_01331 [Flavobacterium glaciei]|uniref:Lipocalin-like protein n=2 Tax=Flavobacterium glaciei TaxID=386300 RepID=A0A562PUN9_9FLAO|nr:hypothetical protein DFR66_105131 [Flavobacterium glaciei]TWI48172.1 hypothetical protein IQ02_01331 [Flavobacterium glaciei]